MKNRDDLITFSKNFGKGIGNDIRCKILVLLSEGTCTVGDIAERVRISQPTASQHLKVLKSGSLIVDEKRGQHVYYTLHYKYLVRGLKNLASALEAKSRAQ